MYIFFYSLVFLFFSPSESKMPSMSSMSSKMPKLSKKAPEMARGAYNKVRDGVSTIYSKAPKISDMRDGVSRMTRGAYNKARDGMSRASKISGSMRNGMSNMYSGASKISDSMGYGMSRTSSRMPKMMPRSNSQNLEPVSFGELNPSSEFGVDRNSFNRPFMSRTEPYTKGMKKYLLGLIIGNNNPPNPDEEE